MSAPNLRTDYLDAMERHWDDAELLFRQSSPRLANADQLYGLSAECGLKALMLKWGMPFSNNQPSLSIDRKHADGIWSRYETYRQGRIATLALPTNPFEEWSIHHRYANRVHFQQTVVEGHMRDAALVKRLVAQACIEGELP
jgi:hypothetical protein